jgi:hypothetical protein
LGRTLIVLCCRSECSAEVEEHAANAAHPAQEALDLGHDIHPVVMRKHPGIDP